MTSKFITGGERTGGPQEMYLKARSLCPQSSFNGPKVIAWKAEKIEYNNPDHDRESRLTGHSLHVY